ncbi:MAG: hypothetical protein GF347_02355 [Candidatus Moranbacteria bacterium]|nr:hypothetical protein [Candidatus Moranbacteria bacterium]
MDANNQNAVGGESNMELVRIQKNYLDELESLRREEQDIVSKFNVKLAEKIFISNWEQGFSYEENLNLFLNELTQVEEILFNSSDKFEQHDINVALSQLRILREKGNTAMAKAMEQEKELAA